MKKQKNIGKTLPSDPGVKYDRVEKFQAEDVEPMVTYGTNPGMGIPISGKIPTTKQLFNVSDQMQLKKIFNIYGIRGRADNENKK